MTKPKDEDAERFDAGDEISRFIDATADRLEIPQDAGELVVLIPVDGRGGVCGNAAVARRDESVDGVLTLICRTPIRARYLQLQPLGGDVNIMGGHVEIIRQAAAGSHYHLQAMFINLPTDESELCDPQ
ncbi:MAG: hypothetical protein AB7O26_04265 [Planctomycetaceae bacterium]